jgi:hypothetical protein
MPSSPPLSAVAVEISSPRKPLGGVKSADGGDCEKQGANFCPFTLKTAAHAEWNLKQIVL